MLVLIQGNGMRIERSLAFLVNFSFLDAMGRRPNNPGIAILTAGKCRLYNSILGRDIID